MVWNRATTPLTEAQGVPLFLTFHPDEAGKGREDPGEDEQKDGFQVGSWVSSGAERVAGGMKHHGMDAKFTLAEHPICTACGAMGRSLPWDKPKFPSTAHLCSDSSHAPGDSSSSTSLMEMSRTTSN